MNTILEHRKFVASQIEKSFGVENDIEKAFPIGTIRNWGGVDYKKISDTEWVKVEKNKPVANSTIIKKLKEDVKELRYKRDIIVINEQNKRAKELGKPTESMQFRVLWQSKYSHNIEYCNQLKSIDTQISDLNSEISELQSVLPQPTSKRNKQITTNDTLFKNINIQRLQNFGNLELKDSNGNYIRRTLSAKEALGINVNSSNYFLYTFANFDEILQDSWKKGEDNVHRKFVDAVAEFNKMKDSGKYEYTHSPKSDSEYLVDKENGVVYRLANHWGKCASCDWYIKFKGKTTGYEAKGTYILAKCSFKDFTRKETTGCLFENPEYIKANIDAVENVLKDIKKHLNNGVVFSTDAKNKLKEAWSICKTKIQRVSNEMKASVDKLEREYECLFAI